MATASRAVTAGRIVRESTPLLSAMVLVQMMTGQILNAEREQLFRVGVLLVLIPVVNGVGGNVGSVLGARLASALHAGLVRPGFAGPALRTNVLSALAVAIITFVVLAFAMSGLAWFGVLDMGISLWELLALLVLSGAILTILLAVITVVTAMVSFRRGWDPDNTVIPVVTTFGDLLGVGSLLLVYGWVFA